MPVPINPTIGTKSNFINRPSVPTSQKQSATEFNTLVSAVKANYERLILNWSTDIAVNTTLAVGQYVLFSGALYIIDTSYNVGSPLTWNASNATALTSGGGKAFSDWDLSVNVMPTDSDGVGSGTAGAIVRGDEVYITVEGDANGELRPVGTIGKALQNSPTLDSHWRYY